MVAFTVRSGPGIWLVCLLLGAAATCQQSALGQAPSVPDAKAGRPAPLAEWLSKVKLSPQQKSQIELIVTEHDAQFAAAWQQFGERYQMTLRTEAVVLATVEESLTETQRRQAHEQRRKLLVERANDVAAGETEAKGLGISLSPEQEAVAKKVHEKFQAKLATLGNEVQQLHNRLLSIEMDKLVEIEKLLTKEQRDRFSQLRQNDVAALIEAGPKAPAKTK